MRRTFSSAAPGRRRGGAAHERPLQPELSIRPSIGIGYRQTGVAQLLLGDPDRLHQAVRLKKPSESAPTTCRISSTVAYWRSATPRARYHAQVAA
jgi:hypothetical protein